MSDIQLATLEELKAFFAEKMPFMRFGVPVRGQAELEALHPVIDGKGFIAGSFAAWVSVGYEAYQPHDIDIFCTNRLTRTLIADDLEKLGFVCTDWSATVGSLEPKGDCLIRYPIQLITPHPDWTSYPLDIVKAFDMDVCRAVVINPETVVADIDAGATDAVILAINSPLRVMKRVMKYHQRGVKFAEAELVKLFTAWDAMTQEQKNRCIEAFLPADTEPSYDYSQIWDEYFFEE